MKALLKWMAGLAHAAIGGGANAGLAYVIDPADFNLQSGAGKLLWMAAGGAILSAFMYLRQSPLPEEWSGKERRNG